jgi:orotidine-5'-phosphate decarboxylase
MKKKSFNAKVAYWFALNKFLMAGLDITEKHIPKDFKPELTDNVEQRLRDFIFHIIDLTAPYCLGWKPNAKFYMGSVGMKRLEMVCDYINTVYSEHILLVDGKDGDIGNTGSMALDYYVNVLHVDAITISPFMGYEDSSDMYLSNPDVACFALCLTSNKGRKEFMTAKDSLKSPTFERIAEFAERDADWNKNKNLHFVVGATNTVEEVATIRRFAGEDAIFLMPGLGAQDGNSAVLPAARNKEGKGIFGIVARDIFAPKQKENETLDQAVVRQAEFYNNLFAGNAVVA